MLFAKLKEQIKLIAETSYYGAMEALFNAIGASFKPSIFCVVNLRNRGSGIPDGGLFTENQQNVSIDSAGFAQLPAHGAIEAKPTSQDITALANSEQVKKYIVLYGQVLATNFYQFVLVTRAPDGSAVIEESYKLAESEIEFWQEVMTPRRLADRHATALNEYLLRVMRRQAPLADPRDVAWILASYAREPGHDWKAAVSI
ncbi:MAG: hypothetical protein HC828_07860 [Blastochloris sp.]|nr:hypothetical protein [Blastochloris sp.]